MTTAVGGALAASVLVAAPVTAHDGNVGLSEITVEDQSIVYDLYLDARFLAPTIPVTDRGDVALPDGIQAVRRADVERVVAEGIHVANNGTRAQPELVSLDLTTATDLGHLGGVSLMGDIPLLHARVAYALGTPAGAWQITYGLFLDDNSGQPHSNLAWLHEGDRTGTYIFAPGSAPLAPGLAQDTAATANAGRGDVPVALPAAAVAVLLALIGVLTWAVRRRRRLARARR